MRIIAVLIMSPFLFHIDSRGLAAETLSCRVWLFKGIKMQEGGTAEDVRILTALTHPQLAGLRFLAGGPENEFADSLIEALLDISDLKQLDELFLFKETWDKARPGISSAVIKKQLAFRLDLEKIKFSPAQLVLRAAISRSREGAIRNYAGDKRSAREAYLASQDDSRMVKIVDQELSLEIGEPVVVTAPHEDGVYYMAILLTPAEETVETPPSTKTEPFKAAELVQPPRPVYTILPAYPIELRRNGVKGEVGIRVTTDEKGKVENVVIRRPLHPYLDYLTVQAFLKWLYEPVLSHGKSVRAAFDYAVRFDPSLYHEETGLAETASIPLDQNGQPGLRRIIAGCANYSRKLSEQALFFTCEESMREVRYQLKADVSNLDLSSFENIERGQLSETVSYIMGTPAQIMDPSRTELNRYVCDYQLVRKNETVEERRIVLKQNGRKPSGWAVLLTERRFYAINPIAHLLKIFDHERQGLFSFQLLGEEKIRGKEAYVIVAVPRLGNEGDFRGARIWADKKSFQIFKIEISGVPIEGYEDVLKDSMALNIAPFFLTTHEYEIEKNGVLFPETTTVRVGYPSSGRPILKYRADVAYKKYRFFSVESSHEIIKR